MALDGIQPQVLELRELMQEYGIQIESQVLALLQKLQESNIAENLRSEIMQQLCLNFHIEEEYLDCERYEKWYEESQIQYYHEQFCPPAGCYRQERRKTRDSKTPCPKCKLFVLPSGNPAYSRLRDDFDFNHLNVSFNGCGFLGIYHVGVACALQYYLPNMKFKNICGASAGAMAAVCLIAGVPLDEMTSDLIEAAHDLRMTLMGAFNPTQDVCAKLRKSLNKMLPENIHILSTGKLHLSVTDVYSGQNILISNFKDKAEVIEAVIASTYIPIFSGIFPPRYRRKRAIDGGFSVNQVTLEDEENATLTVSPFSGDAHICPKSTSRYRGNYTRLNFAEQWTDVSFDNFRRMSDVLWPQSPDKLSGILLSGYHDAVAFLARYGQIRNSCGTCLTVKSTYTPKDVLEEHRGQHQEQQQAAETTEQQQSPYSEDLLESIKIIKEYPDKPLPSQRYTLVGMPLPTMKEVLYNSVLYNPGFLLFKHCLISSVKLGMFTVNKVQSVTGVQMDWQKLVHVIEDIGGSMAHALAPKLFGMQATKVSASDCACDNVKAIQEQTKFSCEFHITQDDAEDATDGPDDEDDEDLDTSTLMSVHLDTFLDQRYEWYSKVLEQLPRVIQQLVHCLMDLLDVPFNTLMFLSRDATSWLRQMVLHANSA